MGKGAFIGMIISGILALVLSIFTGLFGWLIWGVALNGFMGQSRAVNASMYTYGITSFLVMALATALCIGAVYFLANGRRWNAWLASVLSLILSALFSILGHLVCLIIAILVANAMRI